ncbi:hypothetical protein KDK_77790 [Dictyobacter kobayashii]|uniref:Radical SAM core domain-containing protein n=1 Tax=Dictyobacter kobayashii TaxID=2014872 RepID=A0A402AY15_9CHLR|nr:hypothetical protein [Dictyobacter kobayashii]GCE23979.1 hypothetical protein KDK_77790 [Dictyobacter kobayashii]
MMDRLFGYLQEAGRDRQTLGIEARVSVSEGDLDQQVRETEKWRSYGATHISLNTMGAHFKSLDEHLQALRRYKEAVKQQ